MLGKTSRPVVTVLAMLALMAVAAAGCTGKPGTEFVVSFKEAKALKPGDPVTQNGAPIGKVTAIAPLPAAGGKVEVKAKVYRDSLAQTHRRSLAFVADDSGGRQRLEIHPLDAASPPIVAGDRLDGADTRTELELRKAAAQLQPALEAAAHRLRDAVQGVHDFLRSPEAQKIGDDTRRFLLNAQTWADGKVQDLRAKYPGIKRDLQRQIDQATKNGNEALLRVLRDLEKRLDKTPSEAPDRGI